MKAKRAEYEQISEIIVIARNECEAMELTKEEIEFANSYLYNPEIQEFALNEVNLGESKILAVTLR